MRERPFLYVILFITVAKFRAGCSQELGMKCTSHPAYFTGLNSVLMRSWSYKGRPKFTRSVYIPQYASRKYAPISEPSSSKYLGLDLFLPGGSGKNDADSDSITVSFQRQAKIYLLLTARSHGLPAMTLAGWNSEGWAEIQGTNIGKENLSIKGSISFNPPNRAFVFSKLSVSNQIELPGTKYVVDSSKGSLTKGKYWILIAESDGSNSTAQSPPPNVGDIQPGGRCPEELHQLWLAPVRPEENDVENERFATVCAYDHEHGSIPIEAMGYYPRLNYTALKNYNQNESHNGFKGYMLRKDGIMFYYGIHAHLTSVTRFFSQFHTTVFVAVNATTKELLMELSHKGNFGFAAVKMSGGRNGPINEQDEIIKAQLPRKKRNLLRRFNVINQENVNTSYSYRNGTKFLKGRYEQWTTSPMCSKTGTLKVDIQNPATALKQAGDKTTAEMTILGKVKSSDKNKPREEHVVVKQAKSTTRVFKARRFTINTANCNFQFLDSSGHFFTNPNGTVLESTSGPNTLRQFINMSFTITLNGTYRAADPWVGMYVPRKGGKLWDVGVAIDPAVN